MGRSTAATYRQQTLSSPPSSACDRLRIRLNEERNQRSKPVHRIGSGPEGAGEIVGCANRHPACRVDVTPLTVHSVSNAHRRQSFAKAPNLVEAWLDNHLALRIDESPFLGPR